MDINKELKNKVKFKIIMSELDDELKIETKKHKNINTNFNKLIASVVILTIVTTTGLVFAQEIQDFIKNKFNLGKNIDTAIENGYIVESNDDYNFCNAIIQNNESSNLNLGIKVNSYLIDNSNLSIEIEFKYDETLAEYINLDNLYIINLDDLIIIDDEKNILYDGGINNKESFENYCNDNNLNYIFGNTNEFYMNSGLNIFESDENSSLYEKKFIYNFYVEDNVYPTSKQINLIFTKVSFIEEFSSENIILNGNWNISLDIPEKMYNRTEGNYTVINCENSNFEIYAAKLTSTGFELGIKIYGLENPSYPTELDEEKIKFYQSISTGNGGGLRITEEALTNFYTSSPYRDLYENYYTKHFPTSIEAVRLYVPWIEETEGPYVQNSNGDKFYISESNCANQRNSFNEDNSFEFYNKFDMTEYNATEYITAIIELYGSPINILLKKDS